MIGQEIDQAVGTLPDVADALAAIDDVAFLVDHATITQPKTHQTAEGKSPVLTTQLYFPDEPGNRRGSQ